MWVYTFTVRIVSIYPFINTDYIKTYRSRWTPAMPHRSTVKALYVPEKWISEFRRSWGANPSPPQRGRRTNHSAINTNRLINWTNSKLFAIFHVIHTYYYDSYIPDITDSRWRRSPFWISIKYYNFWTVRAIFTNVDSKVGSVTPYQTVTNMTFIQKPRLWRPPSWISKKYCYRRTVGRYPPNVQAGHFEHRNS